MNGESKSCCSPSRTQDGSELRLPSSVSGKSAAAGSIKGMVLVEDRDFCMGGIGPETWEADGEGPLRDVSLSPYWIDRTCVTNAQFSEFADASGYETEAERYGWSFVFFNQIPKTHRKHTQFETVMGLSWWAKVRNANWRKPGGPGTNILRKMDHPVVHVSWNDAVAYADWCGKRLPTEAEWECAARGGVNQSIYPWGDELTPEGKHHCNIWQGQFPDNDTGEDGYIGIAPARSFPRNSFGLYNVCGNVWEWMADWFSASWHRTALVNGKLRDPKGPESGPAKVIKGGSFLCHASYCNRYRPAARTSNTQDSSTCHQGFRCARDA